MPPDKGRTNRADNSKEPHTSMTTIETHADAAGDSVVASFFAGVATWVTSTDHKKIGRLYLGFGLLGLVGATVFGGLLGAERMNESALFDADVLVQLFQIERLALVFFGLLPMTLGLAIAVAPLQLGARQIAFPRLALTGFYLWLGGLVLAIAGLGTNGGIGGGDAQAVDQFLAAHGLMFLGLLASAGSVATSVLTTRAPGMTMRRVPLFAWSSLIGALGLLLVLPVAFAAVILLFVDHRLGIDANFGGSEGIGPWLGWIYSVPAVIAFAVPAVGVAAELIPVTFKARQAVRGVTFAGIALVGVSALAAVTTQAVNEVSLDSDQSLGNFLDGLVPFLIFAGLPLLGLVVVMGLGGLTAKTGVAGGRPRITSAFVLSFLGLGMVFVGVAGNLVMSITDLELVGTSFEEGAVLYVVYGSAMAVMGGIVFWAPKLWGRTLSEKAVFPLALLALGGTVLASLPLYIAGFLDQAGGIPANATQVDALLSLDYAGSAELWNALSMVGHVMMLVAGLAFGLLMLQTFARAGDTADDNPFGGHTIEWSTSSPAPATISSSCPRWRRPRRCSISATKGAGRDARLPAAAPPAPRRQLLVGTALACVAGSTFVGGMLAVWVLLRERFLDGGGERFAVDYVITEVATNVMLMTLFALCLFAQWAVYSAKRGDRAHTALALGVVGILALAFINAQAFVWYTMAVPLKAEYYGALFYAVTGTMVALVVVGIIFSVVAAFRSLGGRLGDVEVLSAHALYWYFAAAAYTAVWFVVYVTK